MPLAVGARLGSYEVLGALGAGAMGYDKRADIHEAFLSLGCAVICWQVATEGLENC